jgi:hypothetical protein
MDNSVIDNDDDDDHHGHGVAAAVKNVNHALHKMPIKLRRQTSTKGSKFDLLEEAPRWRALNRLKRPNRDRIAGIEDSAVWGALSFPHADSHTVRPPAKWAAIGVDSDTDDVLDLLTNTWRLAWPHVIISVTGAAVGTIPDLSPTDREVFQLGLLDAVRATRAWVITGGTDGGTHARAHARTHARTHGVGMVRDACVLSCACSARLPSLAGVMELVGKTMARQAHDDRAVCLGVATWGIVKHNHKLERHKGLVHRYTDTSLVSFANAPNKPSPSLAGASEASSKKRAKKNGWGALYAPSTATPRHERPPLARASDGSP